MNKYTVRGYVDVVDRHYIEIDEIEANDEDEAGDLALDIMSEEGFWDYEYHAESVEEEGFEFQRITCTYDDDEEDEEEEEIEEELVECDPMRPPL